jgi:hypothetical protein
MVGIEDPDFTSDYTYNYHSNGKLAKVVCDDYTVEYTYGDNTITVKRTDEDDVQEVTYTYKDGHLSLKTLSDDYDGYEITDYKKEGNVLSYTENYDDEDGKMTQHIVNVFNDDNTLNTLEVNTIDDGEESSNKLEFEYSTTLNNLSVDLYTILGGLDIFGLDILNADRSKYLPSKITWTEIETDGRSNVAIFTFKYILDGDGYITKIEETANVKDFDNERYVEHYEYTINY